VLNSPKRNDEEKLREEDIEKLMIKPKITE